MKGKIHTFYKIRLSPDSKKLKTAKSERDRERIIIKDTKQRIKALLEDGSFLNAPVGDEEVRKNIS